MQQSEIGHLVQGLRWALPLAQETFADALGRTFATINSWGDKYTTPSPLALQKINTLLNHLGESGEVLQAQHSLNVTEARRSR